MKINHCSKIHSLFLAAILINGLGLVTHATARNPYTAHSLLISTTGLPLPLVF
jgi:hypothetical protein